MSNKVEIVKIIDALRACDLPALFYLYKSETTEVHQIVWLSKTVIALLVERHFMRNMIGIFEKIGTHTVFSALICAKFRPLKCTKSLVSQGLRPWTQTGGVSNPPVPLLKDDKCPSQYWKQSAAPAAGS